ncbi:hypothetical protein B0H11DRAFT_1927512 [Mycena galericulata]|nr:hypothetical protein B0H11DRAFT_1927512 [Mycena galericulata]
MFAVTPARVLSALFVFSAAAKAQQTSNGTTYSGTAWKIAFGNGACGSTDATADLAAVNNAVFDSYGPSGQGAICSCNASGTTADGVAFNVPIADAFSNTDYSLGCSPSLYDKLFPNGGTTTNFNVTWTLVCPST